MTNAVNIAQGGTNSVSWRNRIINGDMRIDQRNAGAAITATGFPVDRWNFYKDTAGVSASVQRSTTAPSGFVNSLGLTVSTGATPAAGEGNSFMQPIEGLNVADLGWGAAGAQTVTLSFWVRSSLTGTFGGSITNSANNRSYPFTYTISAANTFEYKTVSIPGDTSGTWLTTNGVGVRVWFGLGTGATLSGTAGAWAGATYISATGATSVVGTSGATFYITGVQLEAGTAASPFEYRDYGRELMMCQRYFFNAATSGSSSMTIAPAYCYSSTQFLAHMTLPVLMRATPTISWSALGVWNNSGSTINLATLSVGGAANLASVRLDGTVASGLAAGNSSMLHTGAGTSGVLTFSAEL